MILMYLVILVEALWSTRNNLATLSLQLEALRALEADTDITATPVHRKYVMYCRFLGVVLLYASLEILIHSVFNGPPFSPPLLPPPPLTPPPSSPRLPFPRLPFPPPPVSPRLPSPASPSPHPPLPRLPGPAHIPVTDLPPRSSMGRHRSLMYHMCAHSMAE
jgi:hypothetical protein